MKNIIFILLFLIFVSPALAQTATTSTEKKIEELKDRIATKVAELSQTSRQAIFGTVKSVSVSTATIGTSTKDVKIELTDEINVFQYIKGKRTALSIDDIAKDDIVSVFGEYDKTLDLLKAKVIFIHAAPIERTSGVVTEINKTAFTLTVQPSQGSPIIVDIEKFTKATMWDGKDIVKGGFSKIQVGDTVHVVGSLVPKAENRISADRILNLGNMSGTPRPSPTPTP